MLKLVGFWYYRSGLPFISRSLAYGVSVLGVFVYSFLYQSRKVEWTISFQWPISLRVSGIRALVSTEPVIYRWQADIRHRLLLLLLVTLLLYIGRTE